jgi:hypothetical protein
MSWKFSLLRRWFHPGSAFWSGPHRHRPRPSRPRRPYRPEIDAVLEDRLLPSTATISINPYTLIYDGTAHSATGTATGDNGEDLSSLLDLSQTVHTDGGVFTDGWTFAGNSDYDPASGTITDVIGQATASLTISVPLPEIPVTLAA